MKKIIFFFSLLFPVLAFSQSYQYIGTTTNIVKARGGLMSDSSFYLGINDTTFIPVRIGCITQRPQDDLLYIYTTISGFTHWYPFFQASGIPTWQQTLTSGSTFTSNNTINQSSKNIYFSGGGQFKLDSARLTQSYSSPEIGVDSLVTFGNSITFGQNATVPDSDYVHRMAASFGIPLVNKGVSGTVAHQGCASNLLYINPGHTSLTSFCIGLNDFRTYGGGVNEYNGVKNAYEAAMVNQFLSTYTSATNCTLFGSWTTNYNAVVNSGGKTTTAAYSNTLNDSLTVNVTGTSVVVSPIGLYTSARDCIVYIDGTRVDSFSTSNQCFFGLFAYQPMGRYYTGLSNSIHHVKIKVGPGSNFLLIDYVGTLVATSSMKPFIYIHIPHMDATGYAGGNATAAILDHANDSLTNSYNKALAAGLRVFLAHTNDYYIATTSSGLSSDHIHPNNTGHRQIFNSIYAAVNSVSSLSGTLQYSNDGHFYGTDTSGNLKQIPYTQDLTLQRVITNGSNLTVPNAITGTNTLDFSGFSRVSLNEFKVSNTNQALMHGILGVQGPLGTLLIGDRSGDTTTGFILYTSGARYRVYDAYNAKDVEIRDTSFRKLLRNNAANNSLLVPIATLHIGGNDAGVANHTSLKLDSGLLVSSPEKYAIECNGTHLYWTSNGPTRYQLDQQSGMLIKYQHTIFTPATGGTVNLVNGQFNIINPSGTIATLTVNLPSSPANNDVVYIKYTQAVTAVTYGNGTVVDGITAPTAGGLIVLTYDSGSTSWY